jgi:hypothetical protein
VVNFHALQKLPAVSQSLSVTVHTEAHHQATLSQSAFTLILTPSIYVWISQIASFLEVFLSQFCTSLYYFNMHATCPAHRTIINLITLTIRWGVQPKMLRMWKWTKWLLEFVQCPACGITTRSMWMSRGKPLQQKLNFPELFKSTETVAGSEWPKGRKNKVILLQRVFFTPSVHCKRL